jgi:hypothetical protein
MMDEALHACRVAWTLERKGESTPFNVEMSCLIVAYAIPNQVRLSTHIATLSQGPSNKSSLIEATPSSFSISTSLIFEE